MSKLHQYTEEELADIRDSAERGRAPSKLTTLDLVDNVRQARRDRDTALSERDAAQAEVERLREQELKDADAIERLSVQNEALIEELQRLREGQQPKD